jgi:hypothetical protein
LIVERDDRELVGSAAHETVKRLMLRVWHDPGNVARLEGRKALEAVIRQDSTWLRRLDRR